MTFAGTWCRVYHSWGPAVAAGCLAHFYLNSRPDQRSVFKPLALRAYMGVDRLIEHITLIIAISWDTASLPREEEILRDHSRIVDAIFVLDFCR